MKHGEIADIIEKRFANIDSAFDRVIVHFKEEDIHMFRVEVKKLRAFLRLIGAATEAGHDLKLPKKLHKFYRALGLIRSLQIQQKRICSVLQVQYSIPPEAYLHLMKNRISNLTDLARALMKGKRPFKKAGQKILRILPVRIKQATIRKFIEAEIIVHKKSVAPCSFADEALHSTRKLLKDILYTLPYLKEKTVCINPYMISPGQQGIVPIINLLGDFQDITVALGLLHTDCANRGANKRERILLSNMERQWCREKEAARNEIQKMFQKRGLSLQAYPPLQNSGHLLNYVHHELC